MTLPTTTDVDNAVPATGPNPRSDLTNTLLKNILSEISAARRDSVSPKDFAGDPTGAADSTAAVAAVITAMNAGGVAGRFDGGTWRVTSALPQITRPIVVGDGSGEIYVDWNASGGVPIFDCKIQVGEVYTVTAVDLGIVYDASGTFTADSTVTRLTLSLVGAQVMPTVGSVGKLSATNVLVPNENATDQVGVHVEVLAVSGSFVYVPWVPVDTYSTSMQLVMLGTVPCSIEGLRFRGNFPQVVAQDQRYAFVHVEGAIFPRVARMRFRDGSEAALQFAGCFMASTTNIRVAHMRSALLSETPAILGYGVVDVGCWMPEHHDLGGYDVRHLYTTRTFGPGVARVAWGRSFRPKVIGGQAGGCSAACFDTHSDAWEPSFIGCRAVGGYFGESGSPLAFQLRGSRGTISGCRAADFIYGVQLTKLVAAELGGHTISDFRYDGTGVGIRCVHDAGITGAPARQTAYLDGVHIETTNQIGLLAIATDLVIAGTLRINLKSAASACRGLDIDEATTIRTAGGKYVFDCTGSTAGTNPRAITLNGNNCAGPTLDMQVVAGAIAWQGVISENDSPAAANGVWNITIDTDVRPLAVSGAFSSNGAGGLLQPPGALKLVATVNGGRVQAAKTAAYSLHSFDNRSVIPVTSTATITVPSAAILGPEFECYILAVGVAVTIDGTTVAGTVPLASGSMARIKVINNAVYTSAVAMTAI